MYTMCDTDSYRFHIYLPYIKVDSTLDSVHRKSILDVLKESLTDGPSQYSIENEVRYKIIIDLSEDISLVRLLFSFGVLTRGPKTRMLCCSSFLGNTAAEKVCMHFIVILRGDIILLYVKDRSYYYLNGHITLVRVRPW